MANDQHSQCKECGCRCTKCAASDHDVHLHVEIENLKQKLVERDNHIAAMETSVLNEANKFPNGELAALQEELLTWQDKYRRLYEAHRRIQRVNQGLEDKLLRLVDICETEKNTLTKDVATLSHKLAEANYTIKKLTEDNERYKNDVALAIQFLQCKQGNFVSQKLDSLPNEVQAKVSSYVAGKRKPPEEKKAPPEIKSIKVPIPTFPPTAMVYSVPKAPVADRADEHEEPESPAADIVSAAIMAKVLEERERERALAKHCDTCTCSKNLKIIHETTTHNVGTQTGEYKPSVCLRCNAHLDSNGMLTVVRDAASESKSVPIYTHDYDNCLLQVGSSNGRAAKPHVVKVEPNNYLNDSASLCSHESESVQNCSKRHSSGSSERDCERQEVRDQEDAPLLSPTEKVLQPGASLTHHRLCAKSASFQPEKCDSSAKSRESGASDPPRGPRYCAVRVQSGSRNILLDNIHNNLAPVLYTHPADRKSKKEDHNSKIMQGIKKPAHNNKLSSTAHTQSYSSDDCKSFKKSQSYSSDDYKSVNLVGESVQNQQRVAEWIQSNRNNMGAEASSSDNSVADSTKNIGGIDPARYAEMEKNVKKFLFGESQSEFLKKVALGKQNYQNLRDHSCSANVEKQQISRSSSHTETEI